MPKHSGESKNGFVISGRRPLACVASVSVLFRSKERPRNEILGFLLGNSTETLATQATSYVRRVLFFLV